MDTLFTPYLYIVHTFLPPKKGQPLNNGQNARPQCVHFYGSLKTSIFHPKTIYLCNSLLLILLRFLPSSSTSFSAFLPSPSSSSCSLSPTPPPPPPPPPPLSLSLPPLLVAGMYKITAELLYNLSKVQRFSVVAMFLSASEKQGIIMSFQGCL